MKPLLEQDETKTFIPEEKPTYPHSDIEIPIEMLERAEIIGNDKSGYMWIVPSYKLYCPKCRFEPDRYDVNKFSVGSECPGNGWRSLRDVGMQTSLLAQVKKYECAKMGHLERLWVSADIWNIPFNTMIDELLSANKDGNAIQKILWKKWHTKEGAKARIPPQIKSRVSSDNKFWLRVLKGKLDD